MKKIITTITILMALFLIVLTACYKIPEQPQQNQTNETKEPGMYILGLGESISYDGLTIKLTALDVSKNTATFEYLAADSKISGYTSFTLKQGEIFDIDATNFKYVVVFASFASKGQLTVIDAAKIFVYKVEKMPPFEYTEEQSRAVAESWIKTAPTYAFDGSQLTWQNTQVRKSGESYRFTYNFVSAHGGYGDRTGKAVTQVITQHTIIIDVTLGKVTRAIIDDRWDEMTQKYVIVYREPSERNPVTYIVGLNEITTHDNVFVGVKSLNVQENKAEFYYGFTDSLMPDVPFTLEKGQSYVISRGTDKYSVKFVEFASKGILTVIDSAKIEIIKTQ